MRQYKVWFNNSETMKNKSIKVKARDIVKAIEIAKILADELGMNDWDCWKVEMI